MHDLDRVVLEQTEDWGSSNGETYDDPVETLLAVGSDEELEQFMGSMLRSASRVARRSIPAALRAPLTRYLKGAAATALPSVGAAVGRFAGSQFGDAQAGARFGRRIGAALRSQEMELGGADEEREAARQVVKLAERVADEAVQASATSSKPAAAAVVKRAEKAVAPAPRGRVASTSPGARRSGTWTKHGRTITLHT